MLEFKALGAQLDQFHGINAGNAPFRRGKGARNVRSEGPVPVYDYRNIYYPNFA